jgi:aspartyl protease family protein
MDMRKTGTGMIFISCVLGMFVLTWFFGGIEQDQRNPNRDPASALTSEGVEVYLDRNRQGHYMVAGGINGQHVEFLLDTGATDVVIPEPTARRLGLSRGRAGRAMTANGPVVVYETFIDVLEIGDIRLEKVRASINPAMDAGGILLGMSALGRIEFTHHGEGLTLRQRISEDSKP